jgi:hypothetical protein
MDYMINNDIFNERSFLAFQKAGALDVLYKKFKLDTPPNMERLKTIFKQKTGYDFDTLLATYMQYYETPNGPQEQFIVLGKQHKEDAPKRSV